MSLRTRLGKVSLFVGLSCLLATGGLSCARGQSQPAAPHPPNLGENGGHAQGQATSQAKQAKPQHTNHLAGSTSPYLLQHAHNPVDWYPWSAEALEKAKKENKPIFLSIGYSACHWCHVMEREDFENEEIARLLNANFISIKVDREERPDIDSQYLLATEIMLGSGGWPNSVWLTPDLKPFYGGTYFPAKDFKPLLEQIAALWRDDPAKIRAQADRIVERMRATAETFTRKTADSLPSALYEKATTTYIRDFDTTHGGFYAKPKFPNVPRLLYLLDQYRRAGDAELLNVVTKSLDGMANGGLYDHLGGGFHRYSTDEKWLVPHFEKMLYDQAQLVPLYLDAYALTKKPRYKQVAQETLDFVLREMTDPATGGFYSTLDADSEGEEGKFYVWTPAQIEAVLGKADAQRFTKAYGVTQTGNFEKGKSVLWRATMKPEQETALAPLRAKLLAARNKRVRPRTDDKILTAWNGLMIGAFARGYQATGEERYRKAALAAADFLGKTLTAKDGQLRRAARNGKAGTVNGFLDDYAFAADGLLALYAATKDARWLQQAYDVTDQMIRRHWDKDGEGGFISHGPSGTPVTRAKEGEDNATPSPNGIAASVLARLASLPAPKKDRPLGDAQRLRQQAIQTTLAFQPLIERYPAAFPTLLVAWNAAQRK